MIDFRELKSRKRKKRAREEGKTTISKAENDIEIPTCSVYNVCSHIK